MAGNSATPRTSGQTAEHGSLQYQGRPQWLSPELFPFESKFVSIGGARVHYVDEGSGPTLLLLHGNPTYSFLYREIIGGLRDRFRCIALDYPGFGLSTAEEGYRFRPEDHANVVDGFVSSLDLAEITMMVHDWGGPIGLGVAARRPERFKALVIGNTWAWPVQGVVRLVAFSRLVGGPIGKYFVMNHNVFVNFGIPLATLRRKPSRQVMDAYRGPFSAKASRLPIVVFARALLRSRNYLRGLQSGLANLRHLPVLIVWGDGDPAFRAGEREQFERAFPNHRTVILSGAGHFIQEDAPEQIVAAIRAFHVDHL